MSEQSEARPKLIIRTAEPPDIPGIQELSRKVYASLGEAGAYTQAQLRGHQHQFPEGQFVAVYNGKIVGFCATFRIAADLVMKQHDWQTITGRGYASRHDPEGDWLYAMDVIVDPGVRGLRIGQRLYNERKRLCQHLRLKGIVFGGRMPNYSRRAKVVGSPERYLELVREGKQRDPVIGFQMRNGFEPIGILHNFLPSDHESHGHAVHMIWRNTQVPDEERSPSSRPLIRPNLVRVGAVQYQMRAVPSFAEFANQVEYFVDAVSDYKADFAVFPELFTLQLLSIDNKHIPAAEAIAALSRYTEDLENPDEQTGGGL